MRRLIITALITLSLAAAAVVLSSSPAGADETCTPADAYTETIEWTTEAPGDGWYVIETRTIVDVEAGWQRYSWTGGPHESDQPPAFPSDDWQPNVQGDPHGIGTPGAYFRSHGNSGNGDWFYLELVPAQTHEEHRYGLDHAAVECPDPEPEPTDPSPEPTPEPETPDPTPTPVPVDPEPEQPSPDADTPTDDAKTGAKTDTQDQPEHVDELAETGPRAWIASGIAALSVLAGVALLRLRRRLAVAR
jgi:hypothetical protein